MMYLYAMSSMKDAERNIYKVGESEIPSGVDSRLEELDTHYEEIHTHAIWALNDVDYIKCDHIVHRHFNDKRLRKDREWLNVPLEELDKAILLIFGNVTRIM